MTNGFPGSLQLFPVHTCRRRQVGLCTAHFILTRVRRVDGVGGAGNEGFKSTYPLVLKRLCEMRANALFPNFVS